MKPWSNLAKVVYLRTYARNDEGVLENWPKTVERVIRGNLSSIDSRFLLANEGERLEQLLLARKAGPGGRGWWISGSPGHKKIGGAALNNCYYFSMDEWRNFVDIQDMLMLGGGCGASVEHRFVSKLPDVRTGVTIKHVATKDADFIVPDSREGWNELLRRVYESFFESGKTFTYSTVCVRGAGEKIQGFGGTASGPLPLIRLVDKVAAILQTRAGKHARPIDVADIICATGEMVVAGNVRRSAIILLGDSWDTEYLVAKRWDLGPIPNQRANANWSVVASNVDDLHPLFWETYENGEAFGLVNRKNIRKFGRMGELKADTAVGVNPCGEATLESHEPCNLQELFLPNFDDANEMFEAARLMHRWGKRVTTESYHNAKTQKAISKNRRVGTGISGCLAAPSLFNQEVLDHTYAVIQAENEAYSEQLGIPPSIRTTLVKPSGTLSKKMDIPWAPGIHGGFSRWLIQRVRFSANDKLVPLLRAAGHHIEPAVRFDGTLDHDTLVINFYLETPDSVPVADAGYTTWKQLDTLLLAQRHWADQAVSVTVYYDRKDLPELKEWLKNNLKNLKTISFLCHSEHGFKQAPWEAISKEQYDSLSVKIQPFEADDVAAGEVVLDDCEGGACPVK